MTDFLPIPPNRPVSSPQGQDAAALVAAQKLEASFLAEMLKSAGYGEQENSFTGSAGEDHFASFQRRAMAEQLVERGGIGLAEAFYKSMMESRNDTP